MQVETPFVVGSSTPHGRVRKTKAIGQIRLSTVELARRVQKTVLFNLLFRMYFAVFDRTVFSRFVDN